VYSLLAYMNRGADILDRRTIRNV